MDEVGFVVPPPPQNRGGRGGTTNQSFHFTTTPFIGGWVVEETKKHLSNRGGCATFENEVAEK